MNYGIYVLKLCPPTVPTLLEFIFACSRLCSIKDVTRDVANTEINGKPNLIDKNTFRFVSN